MAETSELLETVAEITEPAYEAALGWLTSPAAWSQFGLIVGSFGLAVYVARYLTPKLTSLLTPEDRQSGPIANARRFSLNLMPLLLPLLAYIFLGLGESVTRALFGSGAVIAFGKRMFLFLAARILVRDIISDGFLKLLGKFLLLPVMALYALGGLEPTITYLTEARIALGNISFSAMAVVRGLAAGGVLFWFSRWSNAQSASFLHRQEAMPPATRQLAAKSAEILIFGVAFLVLMNIMGVNLATLAVLGGAVGVGLGFGLQKIASNFISGVILLLEGQATVGDYVELDGGEAGTIVKMTARAAILETFDGRWIVVPNEDFITTRVTNYSDSGSANRYEAPFSVSYDTDINRVPEIVCKAVAAHKDVLQTPYPPDCELRGFGDSGVDFSVEFWINGIDDGRHKYTSDVLFIIWNALKDAGIEIPYPHRVIEIKGELPK